MQWLGIGGIEIQHDEGLRHDELHTLLFEESLLALRGKAHPWQLMKER